MAENYLKFVGDIQLAFTFESKFDIGTLCQGTLIAKNSLL